MADDIRLEGRNGEIWRSFLGGNTQDAIAQRFSISQSRVSQIIAEVRASIPPPSVEEIAQAEADRVAELYRMTMEIAKAHHPVVSLQRGEVIPGIEDAGPRLAAINTALRIHERVAKTYGLEAATKMETTGTVRYVYEGVDVEGV